MADEQHEHEHEITAVLDRTPGDERGRWRLAYEIRTAGHGPVITQGRAWHDSPIAAVDSLQALAAGVPPLATWLTFTGRATLRPTPCTLRQPYLGASHVDAGP